MQLRGRKPVSLFQGTGIIVNGGDAMLPWDCLKAFVTLRVFRELFLAQQVAFL